MRSGVSALFLLAALGSAELCPTAPEIVLLQDASHSLSAVIKAINTGLAAQLQKWAESFPTPVKIGFSSFTDKPIPFRGWGGRNAFNMTDIDGCYFPASPLTTEYDGVVKSIGDAKLRDGGDLAEAQWDAMISAMSDPNVGFTPYFINNDEDNRKVLRIVVMITDEAPHSVGDGQAGITEYNMPRDYEAIYGPTGWGGIGIATRAGGVPINSKVTAVKLGPEYSKQEYMKFSDLFKKFDSGETLSDEEFTQFTQYKKLWGPEAWSPNTLQPHNRGFLLEGECRDYEYASVDDVRHVADALNVIPVILVTSAPSSKDVSTQLKDFCSKAMDNFDQTDTNQRLECLERFYQDQVDSVGLKAVVKKFSSPKTVIQTIADVVAQAADYNCHKDDPVPHTEPVDTTTEKKTPAPTTEAPEPTTEAPAPTTEAPAPITEAPAPEPTTEAPAPTTEAPAPEPTTEAPAPTTEAPAPEPTTEAPAPTTEAPAPEPTTEAPAPTTEAPAPEPTTEAPAPTTEAPAPEPTTEAPAPTTEAPAPEPTTEAPAPEPSTEAPVPSTEAPAPVPSTEAPAPVPTTEAGIETTNDGPIPPPHTSSTRPIATDEPDNADADDDSTEAEKKSNTAIIAGATGGAVAGVAAAGALLYKKFGASMFGKTPQPADIAMQQVENPENAVEREGMEEVTMDMFQ